MKSKPIEKPHKEKKKIKDVKKPPQDSGRFGHILKPTPVETIRRDSWLWGGHR
jgi:hypothetical protein